MKLLFALAACLPLSAVRGEAEEASLPLAPDRPIASLVPERCAVFVEGPGLARLLAEGLDHGFVRALLASPLGARLLGALPLAPSAALERADAWLGACASDVASGLVARGVGLGFDPASGAAVLVALARDGATAESGLAIVLDAVERRVGWPGAFDRPRRRMHGAEVWSIGDGLVVARRGGLVVAGTTAEIVEDTLALAADPLGLGLLGRDGLERALAQRRADVALWSWLELEELEPHADDGLRELRAAERAPAAHGLLGAQIAALVSARALAASLVLDGSGAELELRSHAAPTIASLAPLGREGGVPAAPGGARETLGTALVYRDYARFFTERVEHFPADALPGFAEAITNGALFFEGRDLGEEVLSGVSPWLRLVARELEFAPGRRPEIPLPGLALVAVLDGPDDGERWLAAFQSVISIVNVDQAQKGGRALRLVVGREGDVDVSAARFATPAPGDGVDVRYNLEPALAVCGRHLVLGTHEELVRELVRELDGLEPLATTRAWEALELDARALGRVLAANRAHLVARKMLGDGVSREAAERELEGLRHVLESFEGLSVELASDEPGSPALRLALPFRGGER